MTDETDHARALAREAAENGQPLWQVRERARQRLDKQRDDYLAAFDDEAEKLDAQRK